MLTPEAMVKGDRYNWKNHPDKLIYIGKKGAWHQFKKIGDPSPVWCEILDIDLHMMERTFDLDKTVLMAAMNAAENGYSHWESHEALAVDMCTCDSELENEEVADVAASIMRQNLLKRELVGYVIEIPAMER